MEQELISGTIAAVVFQNQENGYAVIKLASEEGSLITVVGIIPVAVAGERLIVTGHWSSHSSYGRQFEAEFLERLPAGHDEPDSGLPLLARRQGHRRARPKIVGRFGEAALRIL